MLHRALRYVVVILTLFACCGCPPKLPPALVVKAADNLVRIEKGQTVTAQDNGWWVSDNLLVEIMENLRQAREIIRQYRESEPKAMLRQNFSAELGQAPDDSARLLGSMANNPSSDNHHPPATLLGRNGGSAELNNRVCQMGRAE